MTDKEVLAKQEQGEPVALPDSTSKEANDAIEAMLQTYNWPCNTQNAGRAGWQAAKKYLSDTKPQQRKPLTDEQIVSKAMHLSGLGTRPDVLQFARAIESAHGIKENA